MDENRVKGTAKNVAGKVESAVGDLTGDAKNMAAGYARQIEGAAQDLAGQAKEAVRGTVDDASAALGHAAETGARYYDEGNRAVARGIEGNPLSALLAAAAAGYALAWLVHGRR